MAVDKKAWIKVWMDYLFKHGNDMEMKMVSYEN